MHLTRDEQLVGGDTNRSRHPAAILSDVVGLVTDVVTKVQRVVGAFANATEASRQESVDTESAQRFDFVDREVTAVREGEG